MAKGKYEYWLTEDGLKLMAAWARDGLRDEDIAKKCSITTKTLYEWKKRFGEIREALKKGKEIVDIEVENALLDNARGAFYDEEVAFKCRSVYYDDNGRRCEKEEIQTATIRKYRPPETAAAFIWLKNRKPDVWKDHPVDASDNNEKLDAILQGFKDEAVEKAE